MFAQQPAYVLGIFNLILAGIAIFCVTVAEDHPEHFGLVYIAVSIFIFYMGTILIIIILQMIETYQEQHQLVSSVERPMPSQSNVFIDDNITRSMKPQMRLSRSHTLPLTLSVSDSHQISEVSDIPTTSSHRTLLPKCQEMFITIHKNYQSFDLIPRDQHGVS